MPPGWVAPGPPGSARSVALQPDEELSWLLGDWRIIQRREGHRWSLDDFVTVWVARSAGQALSDPRRILDLGSGIGSVALMLGWCFPEAHVTGVEAQEVSYRMAQRSAVANAVEDRFSFIHSDLRDVFGGGLTTRQWDLVTGTPPYFDDPEQTRSTAIQKAPCRFEERGGVGDYLAAIELALADGGRAVICHASRQRARVLSAIARSGLHVARALEVQPKQDRAALVDVFVLARQPGEVAWPSATAIVSPAAAVQPVWERLVVRDLNDQWTPEFLAVRLAMGMPPRP